MTSINFIGISIIAVISMTLFTYFISRLLNRNFGQPELLTQLVNRSHLFIKVKFGIWIGWLIHYFFGVFFFLGYLYLKPIANFNSEILWGLIYGLTAGIIGSFGWKLMLKIHQNPPGIKSYGFYIQLVGAHIVFSLTISFILILM